MERAGGVVLSPGAGAIDAAILGTRRFAGEGVLATVRFVTLAPGDPGIGIAAVEARDAKNRKLTLPVEVHAPPPVLPRVTTLAFAAPNPFREATTFAFDLAEAARVELTLYSVDGRRIRTLVEGAREPGQYRAPWDGRDSHGRAVGPGVYYARFVAGSKRFTRTVVFLR
jgi:hypothetical protein